jgi:hypothetical protein
MPLGVVDLFEMGVIGGRFRCVAGAGSLRLPEIFSCIAGERTMEVVVHSPNEAQCAACGCQTFGKILPELLITKTAVESTR